VLKLKWRASARAHEPQARAQQKEAATLRGERGLELVFMMILALDVLTYQFAQSNYGNWTWRFRNSYSLEFRYAEGSEKMERSPDAPNADFQLCGRISSTKPIFRSGLIRKVISDSFVALMLFAIDRDRYTIAIATAES
jgi:hypothetical protein